MADALGRVRSPKEGLTDGEYRTVCAAILAIMHGASAFSHSRGGGALSHHLTPVQMRQLRSACAKDNAVKQSLKGLSTWLTKAREAICREAAPQRGQTRGARGRIGHLRSLAKEAERSGNRRLAAGLRAIMKSESGLPLADDDPTLMKEAEDWLQRVHRPSLLAKVEWVMAPLGDFSGSAGTDHVRDTLLLAVFCWPEGAEAWFRPEPAR